MLGFLSARQRYWQVFWVQCKSPVLGTVWCELLNLNQSSINSHGVYIIWVDVGGVAPLYVGSGNIRERLGEHRHDKKILGYDRQGTLYATWAEVEFPVSERTERYLAETLDPLVGKEWPEALPMEVNLPWESII